MTLPGWGVWGGAGVKRSVPKKRIIKKAPEMAPRRDGQMKRVIINERSVSLVTTLWENVQAFTHYTLSPFSLFFLLSFNCAPSALTSDC